MGEFIFVRIGPVRLYNTAETKLLSLFSKKWYMAQNSNLIQIYNFHSKEVFMYAFTMLYGKPVSDCTV